jgi:hypothetical protein
MKAIKIYSFAVLLALAGCAKSEIPVFKMEDSAVAFFQGTNNFSVRGMTEAERDLTVAVQLIGPVSGQARPIAYEIEDISAVRGQDYEVVSAEVPAGALSGAIVLRVKKLPEGTDSRSIGITLKANDYLGEGYKSLCSSRVTWTEAYERPVEHVWRYWHLYLSRTYSRNLHKIFVEIYGDEIEKYTCSKVYAAEEGLIFQLPTWWFAANHEITEIVRKHDLANPGDPYRHSSDYELYKTYTVAVGDGDGLQEGQTPPTILETLNSL